MTKDLSRYTKEQETGYIKITPEIKALAEELTEGATTDEDKSNKIYDYIRNKQYFISPTTKTNKLLNREWLDCGSKHALLTSLHRSLGIPTRIAITECPMEGFQNTLYHLYLPKGANAIAKSIIQAFGEDILGGTHYAAEVWYNDRWNFVDATMNPKICDMLGKEDEDKKTVCLSKRNATGVLGCRKIGHSEDVPSNGVIVSTLARIVTDITGATNNLRKTLKSHAESDALKSDGGL